MEGMLGILEELERDQLTLLGEKGRTWFSQRREEEELGLFARSSL